MNAYKLVSTVVLALILISCSAEPNEPQTLPEAERGGSGHLRVWIASDHSVSDIFDNFTSSTGISVQTEFGTQEELKRRVQESNGNPSADLFWSDNALDLALLAAQGVFEPYVSPFSETLPDDARDRDGLWHGVTVRRLALVYNAASFPDGVPAKVEELIHWQEDLTVPAVSSPLWYRLLVDVAALEGETELRQWVERVREMSLTFSEDLQPGVNGVLDGTVSLLFTTADAALQEVNRREQQKNVDIRIQPLGSSHADSIDIVTGVGILRGTDKKEAAQQLVDFMLQQHNRQNLALKFSHDDLLDPDSSDAVWRLHPNEMAHLMPLVERYWLTNVDESS